MEIVRIFRKMLINVPLASSINAFLVNRLHQYIVSFQFILQKWLQWSRESTGTGKTAKFQFQVLAVLHAKFDTLSSPLYGP